MAMSEIRVVNTYLVINGKTLTQPLEILVIGDQKSLMSTLNMAGGVISLIQNKYETEISIEEETSVTINAFTGDMQGIEDLLNEYNYELYD